MQWDELDRLRWSYTAIADRLRRFMDIAFIQELYRRLVFNILVRNTDDHPRNHGVLIDGDRFSLSPVYDVVPSLARAGINTDFRLAMSVGCSGREATIENALSQSERFGMTTAKAGVVIADLIHHVKNWQSHFEECRVSGKEIDILQPSFSVAENSIYHLKQFVRPG